MRREYEALSKLVGKNFAVLEDGMGVYLTPKGEVRDIDGRLLLPELEGRARLFERNLAGGGGNSGGGNSDGGSDNLVVTVNTHYDEEETRITTYDADWEVIKQRFIEGKPSFVRWSSNYSINSRQDIEFENVAPLSQVEFEDDSYATKALFAFSINDSCNMRYVKLYSDGTAQYSSLMLQRVQIPT